MSDRLLFVGFLGFVGGILWCSLFFFSWPLLLFLVLLAVLLFGARLYTGRIVYAVAGVVLLGVLFGSARVMLVPQQVPSMLLEKLGTTVTLEGTIVSDPDIRETSQRVTVETSEFGKKTKLLAVAPLYPKVRYGERVHVSGTLERPEPFDTNGGRVFRYDRFLAKDGIFVLMKQAQISTTGTRAWQLEGMGLLLDARHAFLNALSRALPEPHASLAGGLVAGGKQGLGSALLDAFVVSGLVHIVVLSGYNVMIVAEAVLRMFSFLPKRLATSLAGATIGAFVLAAGAGAASARAGLMAGLALIARATGRTYAVVRALLFVAFVMLLINPFLLAYDPGFQLSFVATLGLILGAPVVEKKLGFVRSPFWRDLLAATLAAQVSVLPLLLYQTGLFSLVSLPANLLVLPVVPLVMLLSAIAGGVGLVVPALAPLVGMPAYALLSYIIGVVKVSSSLPLAAISLPAFPFWVTVLGYVGLGWWCFGRVAPDR
jgi:competence protein ComEC